MPKDAPWCPPIVRMGDTTVAHLLAWEYTEVEGTWWAWVSWIYEAGGRPQHKVVTVATGATSAAGGCLTVVMASPAGLLAALRNAELGELARRLAANAPQRAAGWSPSTSYQFSSPASGERSRPVWQARLRVRLQAARPDADAADQLGGIQDPVVFLPREQLRLAGRHGQEGLVPAITSTARVSPRSTSMICSETAYSSQVIRFRSPPCSASRRP